MRCAALLLSAGLVLLTGCGANNGTAPKQPDQSKQAGPQGNEAAVRDVLNSWGTALQNGNGTADFWDDNEPKVFAIKSAAIRDVRVTGNSSVDEKTKKKIENTARVKVQLILADNSIKDLDVGMVKVDGAWKLRSIQEN